MKCFKEWQEIEKWHDSIKDQATGPTGSFSILHSTVAIMPLIVESAGLKVVSVSTVLATVTVVRVNVAVTGVSVPTVLEMVKSLSFALKKEILTHFLVL